MTLDLSSEDRTLWSATCSQCNYSLRGLPLSGTCPECGQSYGGNASEVLLRLTDCPQCDYSLNGLATSGNCPACGFAYDEDTFALRGMARGRNAYPIWKRFAWVYIIGVVFVGPQVAQFMFEFGGTVNSTVATVAGLVGLVWVGLVVLMVMTAKKLEWGKRELDWIMLAPGGFLCRKTLDDNQMHELVPWNEINEIQVVRQGAMWYRLKLGWTMHPGGAMTGVKLDAGIRCNAEAARIIQAVIQDRIDMSHGLLDDMEVVQ